MELVAVRGRTASIWVVVVSGVRCHASVLAGEGVGSDGLVVVDQGLARVRVVVRLRVYRTARVHAALDVEAVGVGSAVAQDKDYNLDID